LFAGFYLMQQPEGLAHLSKEASAAIWHATTSVFEAVIAFLDELFA
jgi:hypothetical protein